MRGIRAGAVLALAAALGLAGAVSAGELVEGAGLLTAKDVVARTVTIDKRLHHVTERTVITDLDGARIGLQDVRVQDPWGGDFQYVWEAVDRGGRLELERLRLEEAPR